MSKTTLLLDGLRVLIVDDDVDSLCLLKFLLEIHGVKVTAACSASEAVDLLTQNPADVLITDIAMPDQDGFALLNQVRSLLPQEEQIVSIALTACAEKEIREKVIRAGFTGYVTKPFEPDGLIAILMRLVSQPSDGCFA